MEITRENEIKIRELTNIETPFDINKVYGCQKGSCQKITYVSDSGFSAKAKNEKLVKLSVGVVRVGIAYKNLKENQDLENIQDVKGEWINQFLIRSNGIDRLRVYPNKLPNIKTKTYYILNGEIKTKEWIIENGYLQASYVNRANQPKKCFDIKLENILAFGKDN